VYWGQIAVGVAAAITAGYWVQSLGRPLSVAVAAAIVAYAAVRWLLAWAYRTRFWVRRGGRGHRVECPNCHARRHRIGGDWLLQCKRCGWKAGLPVLRWVTRSVPARQLRRTVVGPKLVLVVIAVAVIATGGVTTSVAIPSVVSTDSPSINGEDRKTDEPIAAAESTPQPDTVDTSRNAGADLNETVIEREVHRFVNRERTHRGLEPLNYDTALASIARSHSRDMATERYFAHDSPDGETMGDRYDDASYQCRVPTGGNSYLTGAENIAYTYAYQSTQTERGLVSHDGNETAIARGLVTGWMDSPGHRENILTPEWNNEGIGIYIAEWNDGTRVYATQNFC